MNHSIKFSFILSLLLSSSFIQANQLQSEIRFLKNYIQSSQCQFNRNGDIHSAPEALQHIEKKYQYFKSDITSAEMFIEKSASKSTLSGKAYTVICPAVQGVGQQTLSSKTWLLRALSLYRNSAQ